MPPRPATRNTTRLTKTSRPGCAPITCSGSPITMGGWWSAPATCRSWGLAGGPMGRRPDVALQPQWLGRQDPGPTPDPVCRGDWRPRTRDCSDPRRHPRDRNLAGAGAARRRRRDPVDRERGRPLRAAGLQPVLHDAVRLPPVEDRDPSRNAWSDARRGAWPATAPRKARRAYNLPEIKHWLRVFLLRFFQLSQFKRSALPNGPKIRRRLAVAKGRWRGANFH